MKTSFVSFLALASIFSGVLSAPAPVPKADLIRKQTSFDAAGLITDLTAEIQPYLGSISDTTSSLNSLSSDADKAAAIVSLTNDISSITAAVKAATAKVPLTALLTRQTSGSDPTAIGALITALLVAISNAVNGIVASLGLTAALGLLEPLTGALSNLLLALEVVVDDLLTIVQELVDGLLTALSAALAGLIL